jgi:pilus assembly protein Flp/PilA
MFKKIFKNEKGATAIEYGLIAALVAVGAIGAMSTLGTSVQGSFENAATTLDNAN